MGNMPNKWVARAGAVVGALVSAVVSFFLGRWIGEKLAYGFRFDWYVHPVHASFPVGEVLFHVALSAVLAAILTVGLTVAPSFFIAQWESKRLRYVPPRVRDAASLDVHTVRSMLLYAGVSATLAVLLSYVYLSQNVFTGAGAAVTRVTAEGYVLLGAFGSALGGAIAHFGASVTTHDGVVSGRLVRSTDRNLIARISLFGVRNSKTTVALVLATTLLAGYYAQDVNTNVDVADVLPRGDPNTEAAHNLTQKFKSSFTQQVTFQFRVLDESNASHRRLYEQENAEKLPNRVTEANMSNITDELYVRAIAQTAAYVLNQSPFEGSIASPDLYKLINWTMAGAEDERTNLAGDAAFDLPPTDREGSMQYAAVERGVIQVGAVFAAVDAVTSPNWTQTAVLITVASDNDDVTTKEIGQRALEVRDAWVQQTRRDAGLFQVFGEENPPLFSVDLPIANAHASELTAHDFKTLMPIIAVFIALTLFIAFRSVSSVLVTFTSLAIAVIWTFGAMGALGIPLNTINLAVVPLIMGVGIDYGIHMMNEYQEYRAKGRTMEEAWIAAGGGSAFALFVGALTTSLGLLVMVISPSLLVAQLGLLGNIALVACYVLAVLFIPAFVTLLGGATRKKRIEYQPSRIMPALATGISRTRWGVAFVLVLLVGAAVASASTLHREAFGDPPRNWLDSDPLRQEHEDAIKGFYETETDDVKANVIIIEGDVTDPAVHDYINGITGTLRTWGMSGEWVDPATNETRESRIIADTLKDLPFLVNTYLTVKDGVPGAGRYLGSAGLQELFDQTPLADQTRPQTQMYPQTQEEIHALLDEVMQSPLSQFANLFVDAPDYEMTVIVFSVKAATYEDAESVWNEVQAAIAANEALRPEGVKTSFFGNTAINYLFVAKQVPWLNAMAIATNIIIVVSVLVTTRRILTTVAVGIVAATASTLWFGLLPAMDIGLAINLTLPLVFISAMGSDYALHLALRCARSQDTRATFESVGKGVLFSFVTTLGAFLIFTQISDLAGRRSIIGTCLAIGVVFFTTLLVVPIVYPARKKQKATPGGGERHDEARSVPVVQPRAPPVPASPTARAVPVDE